MPLRNDFRARVHSGEDPIPGRQTYLRGQGSRQREEAERNSLRLLDQVDAERAPDLAATMSALLDRSMETFDHELSATETAAGYVRRTSAFVSGHTLDVVRHLHRMERAQLPASNAATRSGRGGTHPYTPTALGPLVPDASRAVRFVSDLEVRMVSPRGPGCRRLLSVFEGARDGDA